MLNAALVDTIMQLSDEWWTAPDWQQRRQADAPTATREFEAKHAAFKQQHPKSFALLMRRPVERAVLQDMLGLNERKAQNHALTPKQLSQMCRLQLHFRAMAPDATPEQRQRLQDELDQIEQRRPPAATARIQAGSGRTV